MDTRKVMLTIKRVSGMPFTTTKVVEVEQRKTEHQTVISAQVAFLREYIGRDRQVPAAHLGLSELKEIAKLKVSAELI